jgi:hypothetical protein
MNINLWRAAYKTVRPHDSEIFHAFGFRHLSDATAYYVHPQNESRFKTTTLCQPIGEGIMLLRDLFAELAERIRIGLKPGQEGFSPFTFLVSSDSTRYRLVFDVPKSYRDAGVVPAPIQRYEAELSGQNFFVAAFDGEGGRLLFEFPFLIPPEDAKATTLIQEQSAWWLPAVALFLLRAMLQDDALRADFITFSLDSLVDQFVRLHEDLYQSQKQYEVHVETLDPERAKEREWRDGIERIYPILVEEMAWAGKACGLADYQDDGSEFEKYPPDRFSVEAQELIPRLPAEFQIASHLIPIAKAMRGRDCLSALLQGVSGTGKSVACKLICQYIGLPLMAVINCTEHLDEFVLGKYIPRDGKIEFFESEVTKAIRSGGAVVFEEINFAKPQYLAFLNSLLDDNGFVRLDNGELVRRHPDFRFLATMNVGYLGTRRLNAALFNRFQAVITLNELPESSIRRMLLARVPECEPNLENMMTVYRQIRQRIRQDEHDAVISPRNLESWARLARYQPFESAALHTIIPVAREDEVLAKAILGILKLYKWQEIRRP